MKTRVFEYYNFRLCKPQLQVQMWCTNGTFWVQDKMHTYEPFWDVVGREFDVSEYELARENARRHSRPDTENKEHIVFEDGKAINPSRDCFQ